MKSKTLKIRTNSTAKAATVATLNKHVITLSEAFARLLAGRGLISKEDKDFIEGCVSMMTSIRKLRLRASLHVGRGAQKVFFDAKQQAIDDINKIVVSLSEGRPPRYASFAISQQNIADGLDDLYSFRAALEDTPSISGMKDLSATARNMLDWIESIPSALTIEHIMAFDNLSSGVKMTADILERGYITNNQGEDMSLNNGAVQQMAEYLTSLSGTLASVSKIKSENL